MEFVPITSVIGRHNHPIGDICLLQELVDHNLIRLVYKVKWADGTLSIGEWNAPDEIPNSLLKGDMPSDIISGIVPFSS